MAYTAPLREFDSITTLAASTTIASRIVFLERFRQNFVADVGGYTNQRIDWVNNGVFEQFGTQSLLSGFNVLLSNMTVTGNSTTITHQLQGSLNPWNKQTNVNFGAGYASNATSIVVDSVAALGLPNGTLPTPVKALILVPQVAGGKQNNNTYYPQAGEIVDITATNGTNTLTIVRNTQDLGVGSTFAQPIAIPDNAVVAITDNWVNILDDAGSANTVLGSMTTTTTSRAINYNDTGVLSNLASMRALRSVLSAVDGTGNVSATLNYTGQYTNNAIKA